MNLIKGKLENGFKFELDAEKLDDYDLVQRMKELDNGNGGNLPEMLNLILGEEQTEALKEHVRTESGRVPYSAMANSFYEMMRKFSEGKKS